MTASAPDLAARYAAGDLRALVAVQKSLSDALSTLGFDPTARSRLGLAEVKRASKLDELRARRTPGQ